MFELTSLPRGHVCYVYLSEDLNLPPDAVVGSRDIIKVSIKVDRISCYLHIFPALCLD